MAAMPRSEVRALISPVGIAIEAGAGDTMVVALSGVAMLALSMTMQIVVL
jgi:hypothetical protein